MANHWIANDSQAITSPPAMWRGSPSLGAQLNSADTATCSGMRSAELKPGRVVPRGGNLGVAHTQHLDKCRL